MSGTLTTPPLPGGRRSRALVARDDALLPALLEFQSPSAAILAAPVPPVARNTIWVIGALFASAVLAMALIPIDRVVSAGGKVVSKVPTTVMQPLETSIVRSIDVQEGQVVHAGDLLARLDPTFTEADVGSLEAQVGSLQAEATRMHAELADRPFTYTGADPHLQLQAAIAGQRASERRYKIEGFNQQISSLAATIQRSIADAEFYKQRVGGAQQVEAMRKELEKTGAGSRLNSLSAEDARLEVQRGLESALNTAAAAKRDLQAKIAERDTYEQTWRAETSQQLAEGSRKLSDAREQLNKAQRRNTLIRYTAPVDSTVQSIAKVSVGSVLQSGDPFITLVPLNAPLEIEANVAARDNGFVHVGDPVAIKFDTFPFAQYGLAYGTLRSLSADSFTAQDEARQRTASGNVAMNPNSTESFYRARISLDDIRLHNTPPGFFLQPGMPVAADVKVGKRTVIGYLMGKVLPVAAEGMREP